MPCRPACLGSAFVICSVFAATARASDPDDVLAAAHTALDAHKYRDALALAAPLRKGGEPRTRLEALEITAVAQLESNDTSTGKATVAEIYTLAPGFSPGDPTLPDSVAEVFRAEAARPHARQVTLRLEPGTENRTVDVYANGAAAAIRIACRERGTKAFVPMSSEHHADALRVRLTSTRVHDCFALAVDQDELPLGRLGSRTEPVEITPPSLPTAAPAAATAPTSTAEAPRHAAGKPITSRWWFWAGLGAVAAIGVATVVIAATAGHSGPASEDVSHAQVNKLVVHF